MGSQLSLKTRHFTAEFYVNFNGANGLLLQLLLMEWRPVWGRFQVIFNKGFVKMNNNSGLQNMAVVETLRRGLIVSWWFLVVVQMSTEVMDRNLCKLTYVSDIQSDFK